MKKVWLVLLVSIFLYSCNDDETNTTNETPVVEVERTPTINYTVTNKFLHDKNAFIEGFFMHDGKIYESTGSPEEMPNTKSIIGILDTVKGKLQQKAQIDSKLFGEGIAIIKDKLYQLTYQAKKGFVYDAKTFKKLSEFNFQSNEGWGLTTDGTNLIMSDGTHLLTYINPENFSVVKTVGVNDEYGPVQNINELEFVNEVIYANVYTTGSILKIDASTGKVVGKIDASPILNEMKQLQVGALEMNGIAYNSAKDVFLVTGKMWPKVFEIKLN
jgi:glutaminyl-peptide cyclotransferase